MRLGVRGRMLALCCAAAMVWILAACGVGETGTPAGDPLPGEEQTFQLTLGHGLAEDHAVHTQLLSFAQAVEEASDGTIQITVIPGGTLGTENENITQIQVEALDMAKVSASTLGNFNEKWDALSIPYLFESREHYQAVMDGEIAQELYQCTQEDGFIGLTWLDSGARSFYTVSTPIRTPEDLAGLRIRIMDSHIAVVMMNALGGTGVIMDYSDVHLALEQGAVEGAENNITALRDHGDVVKYYCCDEHTRIPDILVLSTAVWEKMSQRQRQVMVDCAGEASQAYQSTWQEFEDQVRASVAGKVEIITDVDTKAFREACQVIYDSLAVSQPETYAVVEEIQAAAPTGAA